MRWTEIIGVLDPRRLASELEVGVRMRRAFLVFGLTSAVATLSYVYSLTVKTRWINPFNGVLSGVYFPFTSPRDVAFSGLGYVVIGTVVTMFVLATIVYVSKPTRGFSAQLVSAVLHATVAVGIASAFLLAYNVALPERDVYVVGFELTGLKLENVTYVLVQQGNVTVEGEALILRAERVTAFVEGGDEALRNGSGEPGSIRPVVRLSDVSVRKGLEITTIGDAELVMAKYDLITYDSLVSYRFYPPISRDPVSIAASVASWLWLVVYSVWAMKRLTGSSGLWAFSAASVTLLVLLVLGIL
ncbi:MAG: hypothetical protein NYU90_02285 [Aigarchaeota archaeon]|nr:hypothetical protein [Candidatus Calditenuis fumarioli]